MVNTSMIWPIAAQVLLTFIVIIFIPILRIGAVNQGTARITDYLFGDTENVPVKARLVNRNLMNLLQMPVLFYVVCLSFIVTQATTYLAFMLAWGYVACRIVHSIIHIGYNNVLHRFIAFLTSNIVLFVMWVELLRQVG